jgi:hypothetical protein
MSGPRTKEQPELPPAKQKRMGEFEIKKAPEKSIHNKPAMYSSVPVMNDRPLLMPDILFGRQDDTPKVLRRRKTNVYGITPRVLAPVLWENK